MGTGENAPGRRLELECRLGDDVDPDSREHGIDAREVRNHSH
jgi:hypothetical protein